MLAAPLPPLPERYRVVRELGAGGMATVHLAEDLRYHRLVAIKVLRPELSAAIGAERFVQEIELTAALQHPHVLPLFDSGEADGRLFYVMPYIEGESLRARLDREGRLPVADAVQIVRDVAAGLAWAHEHGVVHRDVKPENVLLAGGEAIVGDFGIALALSRVGPDRITGTGFSLGTPAYMSPEQIAGDRELDGRSDQYGLACVFFEMLAGEPPFSGRTTQALMSRALVEPPRRLRALRPEVPPEVDAAVARALAKDPAGRHPTMRAFADACVPRSTRRPGRRALLHGGAALAAVAAAVVW
ncbi:serine/threonine-protein kinase, partial [Roseisolibacter sp. H3M3-2]|uniref:serine/threonine-protein kinase n=1 Tax=Roseisolibacter sp. H3M3-2 TaxID=3031323 RepID=UPI0023DC086A